MFHLTTALDAASAVPLYEQLYDSLAEEMRTGAIPAGTRMPGKRRLAAELSVSVNTVDAASSAVVKWTIKSPSFSGSAPN